MDYRDYSSYVNAELLLKKSCKRDSWRTLNLFQEMYTILHKMTNMITQNFCFFSFWSQLFGKCFIKTSLCVS